MDAEDGEEEDGSQSKSVQIGAQRRARLVQFAKLNLDAYKVDVITQAKDDLKKLDLKVMLLRKQHRADWKQLRKKKILDNRWWKL